jgi:hypothetical protein
MESWKGYEGWDSDIEGEEINFLILHKVRPADPQHLINLVYEQTQCCCRDVTDYRLGPARAPCL